MTRMSFEDTIARANMASPNAEARVFIEYADGKRGFMKSFPSAMRAVNFCNSTEGDQLRAIAYHRDGEQIETIN